MFLQKLAENYYKIETWLKSFDRKAVTALVGVFLLLLLYSVGSLSVFFLLLLLVIVVVVVVFV